MKKKLSMKFWFVIVVFSLFGQVAWVVENMYFNVFIFQEFNATPSNIALMVSLSAITATLTTLLIGALSDQIGKRKIFICGGYILWGLSIMTFSLFKVDTLSNLFPTVNAFTLGISLVIIFDCIMTFFGSSANDAAFNAWITDNTDETNRGKVEGINSIMPLISILAVFGCFMGLTAQKKWDTVFLIIGCVVMICGIIGIFVLKESNISRKEDENYFKNIYYGFRYSVIKENKTLYIALLAYAIFGIVIQIFMPYLILYYQYYLQLDNYVLIMAPAIIIAAIITSFFGRLIDKIGFKKSIPLSLITLMIGLIILYFVRDTALVFIGSMLMMSGFLSSAAAFGAITRDYTPKDKVGLFQGIRMFAYVLIPMLIGPWIGSSVISNNQQIISDDGTISIIPDANIFLAAFLVSLLIWLVLYFTFKMIKPKTVCLDSNYTNDFNMNNPLSDYPRPQLIRDSYISLNGTFDFEISKCEDIPDIFTKQIIVPYPVQSKLSRVNENIDRSLFMFYRKTFKLNSEFIKDKVLIHFDHIDQVASIYINNNPLVIEKSNGYLPIVIDIKKYLKDDNELIVIVKDRLNKKFPYGKQTKNQGGMWYTNFSGIVGNVWIESVSEDYIQNIQLSPNVDNNSLHVEIESISTKFNIKIFSKDNVDIFKGSFNSKCFDIEIKDPNLWSPENPYLYNLEISSENDKVLSYFAMRKIEIASINGVNKITLNNKPYFFNGILDQGYYSDGLILPASTKAYYDDIMTMKRLGFNTIRKHIKVEPLLWYSMCDKLGMIVFQDMVNNSKYSFFKDTLLPTIGFTKLKDINMNKNKNNRQIFIDHSIKIINHLYNTPSILLWTIFNEGWGQFESQKVYKTLKRFDNTRLYDVTSGWFDNNASPLKSLHIYFKKVKLKKDSRPVIISEFGGYSYKILENSFNLEKTYGYRFFKDQQSYENAFISLYENEVIPNIKIGLCGTIYTQLSDVEDETNGILTYDRKICKLNINKINDLFKNINNN